MGQTKASARFTRRYVLKSALAATTLFLPQPFAWVWAQSEGTLKLLRLPKMALVIGNSKYQSAPALFNPGNDARAMADTLRRSGFEVTALLDVGQAEIAEAIRKYTQKLAANKAVGLFYFAGHGLQLAWRNYLVPVDAAIQRLDDILKSCVDLLDLIDGIKKASNPLNVVILDACRDNPFAGELRIEHRGLSQMDAPHSTLLAYATAPGNVASDGEGANGLYTENLVREMQLPEAKLEDVFKRVRLNVRRRTNGQQIPWESTSLEDDFYFVPPKDLQRFSEAEAERLFAQELALWEKIKNSKQPEPLEEYLRRFPGGKFSELAQLHLERVLAAQGETKIEITPQTANPFTKGSAAANTRFRVGDSYTYRSMDTLTGLQAKSRTEIITAITDTEVIFDDGRRIHNLSGSIVRLPDGRRFTDRQDFPAEYTVGKQWKSTFNFFPVAGDPGTGWLDYRILGREDVTVPAGTFHAFRIEGRGWTSGQLAVRFWVDPERVRRPIAFESLRRNRRGDIQESTRAELVAFTQS